MLNEAQWRAVRATQGRILVLAGAGSGKTGVIVHRIAYLIREQGVDPKAILGLTFTNKAAAEMRHRVEKMIGAESAKQVTLSTFHSFCMQILRRWADKLGFTRHFSLYDERDMERLIKQLAREMLGHEGELPSLAATRTALTQIGNGEKKGHDKFSLEMHGRLQSLLRAHNAVSFDHLIQLTLRLFEEHPDILTLVQERYHYLMIDEYQDTNGPQFRLAELLAKKRGNLFVVGDDDQSIYGWRGAEVTHILNFKADQIIKLEQNYRSTMTILEAANAVIGRNESRHKKNLWSQVTTGDLIEVFNGTNETEEAQGVIDRLIRLREERGLRWRDMVILYRSNALSRQFEMALINASWQFQGKWLRGIPYEVFGGLEFSERSEIKDLVSYLRVIANEKDQEALLRILNVPRRGISDEFLDELTQKNRAENISLWNLLEEIAEGRLPYPKHPKGVSGIRSFVQLIRQARHKFQPGKLADALQWFIEESKYKKAIEEEVKSEKMRLFKWENVQECVNAIAQYEQEDQGGTLADFCASTALAKPTFASHVKKSSNDAVQLMTMHSSKGLEFPVCFLVGLEDHILPHEKSREGVGIEEERRLFYVGITRAMKTLILSMARSRMRNGVAHPTNPSRFLFEIPKHLLKATSAKNLSG